MIVTTRSRRRFSSLGDTCPAGQFWEAGWDGQPGQCLVQTQSLETSGTDVGTPYYQGIYGPASVSPVGIRPLNLQTLDPAVRAAIVAAGHTIDCRRECDPMCMGGPFAGDQCCSELCSVDGGPYEHGAYAINASPGVLLTELTGGLPLFGRAQPSSATPPSTPAPAVAPPPSPGCPPPPPEYSPDPLVWGARQGLYAQALARCAGLKVNLTRPAGSKPDYVQIVTQRVTPPADIWSTPGDGITPWPNGAQEETGDGTSDLFARLQEPAFGSIPWWAVLAAAGALAFSGGRQ